MPDSANLSSYAQLLKLRPVGDDIFETSVSRPVGHMAATKRRRWANLYLFLGLVIAPTLMAVGYFGLLAADRFESEARFVLRTPSRNVPTPLTSALQTAGIGHSSDDAYAVREYLLSRASVERATSAGLLPSTWNDGGMDFFWRFPSLFGSSTREGLYRHYLSMVSVTYDATSSVSTLRVQAFNPEKAAQLAALLLKAAEELVNRLNERARADAVAAANREVSRMEQRVAAAQKALTSFRNREALVDPAQASLLVLHGISKLSLEAAQISTQLTELRKAAARSPQIVPLETRLTSIEAQIAIERRKLAGNADSVANKITEYETLSLEREFSERALTTALAAVELARMEALRQQVYLERVAEPNSPDRYSYPYRIFWCLVILLVGYMAFRIVSIFIENLHRHVRS